MFSLCVAPNSFCQSAQASKCHLHPSRRTRLHSPQEVASEGGGAGAGQGGLAGHAVLDHMGHQRASSVPLDEAHGTTPAWVRIHGAGSPSTGERSRFGNRRSAGGAQGAPLVVKLAPEEPRPPPKGAPRAPTPWPERGPGSSLAGRLTEIDEPGIRVAARSSFWLTAGVAQITLTGHGRSADTGSGRDDHIDRHRCSSFLQFLWRPEWREMIRKRRLESCWPRAGHGRLGEP